MFADESLAFRILDQRVHLARSVAEACASLGLPGPLILETGDAVGVFAGDSSPITQVHCVKPGADLRPFKEFYAGRSASWEAIVTPFSGVDAAHQLGDMGLKLLQFENIVYRSLKDPVAGDDEGFDIRPAESAADRAIWSDIVNRGFHGDQIDETIEFLGKVSAAMSSTRRYLAYVDGKPVAGAALSEMDDMISLGGAATLPEYRGRGLHSALVSHRLRVASEKYGLAIMECLPGSSSQRNSERFGFRLAYTQLCFSYNSAES